MIFYYSLLNLIFRFCELILKLVARKYNLRLFDGVSSWLNLFSPNIQSLKFLILEFRIILGVVTISDKNFDILIKFFKLCELSSYINTLKLFSILILKYFLFELSCHEDNFTKFNFFIIENPSYSFY